MYSFDKMPFKMRYSLIERQTETLRIIEKYPDRIPIICEKIASTLKELKKKKYLIPCDFTIGQFIYVLRQTLYLKSEEGLYLFINGIIPQTSLTLGDIYWHYKDIDGFLYITYTIENTFG